MCSPPCVLLQLFVFSQHFGALCTLWPKALSNACWMAGSVIFCAQMEHICFLFWFVVSVNLLLILVFELSAPVLVDIVWLIAAPTLVTFVLDKSRLLIFAVCSCFTRRAKSCFSSQLTTRVLGPNEVKIFLYFIFEKVDGWRDCESFPLKKEFNWLLYDFTRRSVVDCFKCTATLT